MISLKIRFWIKVRFRIKVVIRLRFRISFRIRIKTMFRIKILIMVRIRIKFWIKVRFRIKVAKGRYLEVLSSFIKYFYCFQYFRVDGINPDDLDMRKSTGTSCQIEIHFMIKTTEYLL